MSVVADASVLIFLGKIKRLGWIRALFKGPYYVPDLVQQEVLMHGLPPSEESYLREALSNWRTIPWRPRVMRLGGGLSISDISVIEVAKKKSAQWVLADEKSLRQVLQARRHKVMGTLGIVLMAVNKGHIQKTQAKEDVNELIRRHRFHISAATYQTFLRLLSA